MSMSPEKGSSSNPKKRKQKPKEDEENVKVEYTKYKLLAGCKETGKSWVDGVICCEITMIPGNEQRKSTASAVMLHEEKNQHWCNIMENTTHVNILKLHLPVLDSVDYMNDAGNDLFMYHIEEISGRMEDALSNISCLFNKSTYVMPSEFLSNITRQYINGLEYLHSEGYYHGEVHMKKDFYYLENGNFVVKLAYLKEQKGDLKELQLRDWKSLGNALNQLRERLELEIDDNGKAVNSDMISDLSKFLGNVTLHILRTVKDQALEFPYFMTARDRIGFMSEELQEHIQDKKFVDAVEGRLDDVSVPWNTYFDSSLVNEMERTANKSYDKYNRISFLSFVSALYTHYLTLEFNFTNPNPVKVQKDRPLIKRVEDVDSFIMRDFPKLCNELWKIQHHLAQV